METRDVLPALDAPHVPQGFDIAWPLTVYYDRSCHLCRGEIDNIAARDVHGLLHFVDCSAADFDARAMPVSREVMLEAIHARDAAGVWMNGVAVFVAMYAAAEMGMVARFLNHRRIKPLMERAYPWIARHRYIFSWLGVHHAMNFFAARARKKRERLMGQAQRATRTSASCVGDVCRTNSPGNGA
jgi:predicted DCC family thiol-disulfide oxidoreductase YuxK